MIHVLLGTRAQIIKMIPVMHLLQQRGIEYNFIFLAQHRETVYEMLEDFSLKQPDHVLGDQGGDIVSAGRMAWWSLSVLVSGIRNRAKLFRGDKRGIVLVHGDAPPLLLGALLARAQGLTVASVEAGLRSFNLFRPFPEELIRLATGKLGLIDIHFCQNEAAMRNASRYPGRSVDTGGNTLADTIRLNAKLNPLTQTGRDAGVGRKYAVVTVHRFETIARRGRLSRVVELVTGIAKSVEVKFILHPPTDRALRRAGLYDKLLAAPGVELLPRLGFRAFQALAAGSEFMVTDGGSNQEESYYLGIPCLLMRRETEREEGLGKNVVLSAFDQGAIDQFVANYEAHRIRRSEDSASPSAVVVDEVAKFAG